MSRKISNEELGRLSIEEYKSAQKTPLVIVLDNVRSLHNIGSTFRTGDSFRVAGIALCGFTAQPPHREIHKTALGATESVDWEYFESTMEAVEKLKERGFKVMAIEQVEGASFLQNTEIRTDEKYALVFGNEVKGVAQEVIDMCDGSIEIPQTGTKHSLNISVSVGVVVWEFFKKLSL